MLRKVIGREPISYAGGKTRTNGHQNRPRFTGTDPLIDPRPLCLRFVCARERGRCEQLILFQFPLNPYGQQRQYTIGSSLPNSRFYAFRFSFSTNYHLERR